MFLFQDDLVNEYSEFKKANPNSFNWWSYVNMKSDLQTALGFAKLFYPEVVEIEDCLILKDRYSHELYNQWKSKSNDKTTIEKMMNLYQINDFFHINRNQDEDEESQQIAFGKVLQHFWEQSFKERFPNRIIKAKVFEEYGDLFITVYEYLANN